MTTKVKTKLSKKTLRKIWIFKFMSPGNPQQNGVVERVFYTPHFRMRIMMAHSGMHDNLKTFLCPKCATTVT